MLRSQAVLQADFMLVLRTDGQHREEGGSQQSVSVSLHLFVFAGDASGDEWLPLPTKSRGPAPTAPASHRVASGQFLGTCIIVLLPFHIWPRQMPFILLSNLLLGLRVGFRVEVRTGNSRG